MYVLWILINAPAILLYALVDLVIPYPASDWIGALIYWVQWTAYLWILLRFAVRARRRARGKQTQPAKEPQDSKSH